MGEVGGIISLRRRNESVRREGGKWFTKDKKLRQGSGKRINEGREMGFSHCFRKLPKTIVSA